MTIPGDIKQEYCPVCGQETFWEYVEVKMDDGVFDLDNAFRPETHIVHLWRCCNHVAEQEGLKEESEKVPRSGRYVTWETQ